MKERLRILHKQINRWKLKKLISKAGKILVPENRETFSDAFNKTRAGDFIFIQTGNYSEKP